MKKGIIQTKLPEKDTFDMEDVIQLNDGVPAVTLRFRVRKMLEHNMLKKIGSTKDSVNGSMVVGQRGRPRTLYSRIKQDN